MHGYLFFICSLASYEHCEFYCSMVLALFMVFIGGMFGGIGFVFSF